MNALAGLWSFVIAWYNLPFSLAILASLALSVLQFVGLDQDHDADTGVDHDLDVDQDVDIDHDADIGHDADINHDVDAGHDLDLAHASNVDHDVDHVAGTGHETGGPSGCLGVLTFLGVGQAPLTMVLLILLSGFGLLGWGLNAIVTGLTPAYPAWVLAVILPLDLAAGVWFTSRAARFIGRAIPAFSTTATPLKNLVGRRGTVASPHVDASYGQVKVRDRAGTLITVFAVVDTGKPAIARDAEVVLVDYDALKKRFVVVPSDL